MITKLPNHPRMEMVRLDALHPNPANARKHNRKSRHALGISIKRFGFVTPIIATHDGMILAGHGRYDAAKDADLKEVPVIRVEFLTDEDYRAFALAENRVAELSGWDDVLLAAELGALFEGGYDIEVTGFTTADLDFSIPELKPEEKDEAVELPDPKDIAVSRLGDLWHIGPHRIYNGDSRRAESYEALTGGELAVMVFADAPYNVAIAGHVSGLGAVQHREFEMMSGEATSPEFVAFLRACFRNCVRFSVPASIHYQCMDWRHMREMLDAAEGVYTELKNLAIYDKGSGSMGSFYRSQHELVFIFKSGKGKHRNNFGLGETRYRTNVWKYKGAATFGRGRKRYLEDHPTIKSAALVADAILDVTDRGDLVLDPFCGSGTTILAAHRTGRRGAAIEIDPLYVDTAIRRLTAATGLEAVHADGRTFEEVTIARAGGEVERG